MSSSHPARSMRRLPRLALLVIVAILFGTAIFSASFAKKLSSRTDSGSLADGKASATSNNRSNKRDAIGMNRPRLFSALLPQTPPDPDLIETFAADCTTPKSAFNFGDVACAKISGGPPLSLYPRRFAWVDTDNNILRSFDVLSDPQTDLFTIPAVSTSTDYRGVWRVNDTSASRASVRTSAFFTVSNPAQPAADLFIYNGNDTNGTITAGSNISQVLWLSNKGPDAATNVQVSDVTPANTTFLSGDVNDPAWNCTFPEANSAGTPTTCTIASLAPGATARITLVFNVNPGTAVNTTIADVAHISSETPDPRDDSNTPPSEDPNADPSNNTATSRVSVIAGAPQNTCTLSCPDNINAVADTTEGTERGTHVTFDVDSTGTCGAITATPASGSFFPVGSTTVNVTSETGGGSCSFVISVEDNGTNPPNITCPGNPPEQNADSSCSATVSVGTATATGSNVTIFATRSDGKPMYTCDANGTNCTRLGSDAPFASGITTITWIAHSHDVAGPYASEDDEIAHRTGAASCTETVTVNDVTPPTITPPANQPASADATCQFALLDYTTMATVSDNCACDSSDNSEICDTRQPITITQSPAPGTLVGLGPHTITLTANDGSSNNGGAGNTATAQFTVTVSDTTAPAITCPGNITTSNDAGQCTATVNPGTATATDNCDSTPTIVGTRSDNQPLNAPYPKGSTTITWTATDDANNSSSCTQTITVNDTELPTISCPVSFTLEPTCPTGAVGTYTTPVGVDNCPGAITTRTAGLASGAVFPIGNTTVTYSVTDASGNGPVSCSFTVTVLTPQAVIQSLISSVNASSLTGTQKNGLLAKLNAALSAINSGQNVACNKLSDFVNNVGTLISHGDISAAQGNAWISSANHVRNTIGCTNLPCS